MRNTVRRLSPLLVVVSTFLALHSYVVSKVYADNESREYKLTDLALFTRSIVLVREYYVEPQRVAPRAMFIAAIDAIQRTVPEVLSTHDESANELTVSVDTTTKKFATDGIESPWEMSFKLKEVCHFLDEKLGAHVDRREIEYAAISGMLSTLDPHSVLLRPDFYKEMSVSTRGHFGGLGIVISNREGQLTVMKVLEETPAARHGVKALDRIVTIDDESTINLALSDAVNKLRGPVGTQVVVGFMRKGWTDAKKKTLTRARIEIRSIESRSLGDGIGYVRIKSFQANTSGDLVKHIADLKRKNGGLKGLVLDLRGNTGGLLPASVRVADLFLESGVITTTVGMSDKVREPHRATGEGTERDYPLVVLVSPGSASASEIVAGAIKNNDRGIVLGETTFGKGSVQVLYDLPEIGRKAVSALKLTIAHYLTPGDVSIQSVGITPDIGAMPVMADKERIDIYNIESAPREKDLERHLSHSSAKTQEKPTLSLKYLVERPKEGVDRDDPDSGPFVVDTPVSLARDLAKQLAEAKIITRQKGLEKGRVLVLKREALERGNIEKALAKLGIDWSPGEKKDGADLATSVSATNAGKIGAGDKVEIELSVENKGSAAVHQLRASVKSENSIFDNRDFLLGRIPPGKRMSWRQSVTVPKDTITRRDTLTFTFSEANGVIPAPQTIAIDISGLPRPLFAFSTRVVDAPGGNGDGLVQAGETIDLVLSVKNIGDGKAFETHATFKNLNGRGVDLKAGQARLDNLAPGEIRDVRFKFAVRDAQTGPLKFEVTVADLTLREYISEKISLPFAGEATGKKPATVNEMVRVDAESVEVREGASKGTRVVGTLAKGDVVASFQLEGLYRQVAVGKEARGWVLESTVKAAPGAEAAYNFAPFFQRQPPKIEATVAQNDLSTTADKVRLTGTASDDRKIRDIYIMSNEKKVFYAAAKADSPKSLTFDTMVPLKKGRNRVLIVARESEELTSRRVLMIIRR
ncbi:MAG: PDZ domain-containing protein [Deltaproteobacteria bacterium]|nr:PDZ domain-containing protein [Deltaproteobacteria bacterium]